MILLTGATGLIGRELLPKLTAAGHQVRALVRDPKRLGSERVNVQISLGNLADPFSMRHALRGVDTVIHLAATIRDQPAGTIEELNGLATERLLRSAERVGVKRFIFFSALNASEIQRTRFFRSKALAERAVAESSMETTVFAPSIVYGPGDQWITLLERFSLLPAMPVSGDGRALYQPMWARDAAACVAGALENGDRDRYELAGPETLTHTQIVQRVLDATGRSRPLIHLPLGVVRAGLRAAHALAGPSVFATWEEAELMEVPMTSDRGIADAEALGVTPEPMSSVLGLGSNGAGPTG